MAAKEMKPAAIQETIKPTTENKETPVDKVPAPMPIPVVKPAVENKPLSEISIKLPGGRVSVMAVRVVGGFVLYNDGIRNLRQPIKKGLPVIITIKQ